MVANCWSGPFAPTEEIAEANAALIVRAVNCHARWLALCEHILAVFDEARQTGQMNWTGTEAQQLRTLIAEAKGSGQ